MDDLISLVQLITRKKISDKYILKSEMEGNKQDHLYLAIKNGVVHTEEEAILLLYDNEVSLATFQRLKSRLKEKLLNSLLTMDLSIQKYSSLKNAYYKILKNYTIANMLRLEGNRPVSVALLEETLTYSIKYEVTEYTKLISSQLIEYYSIQNIDNKKREKFQQIYEKVADVDLYERKANTYYYELSNIYLKKDSREEDFIYKLRTYSNELTRLQNTIESYSFNHKTYSINSTLHIIEKNYDKAIVNATNAIEFFQKKPFNTLKYIYTFNVDKITSFIMLNRYDEAEILIDATIEILPNKTQNYFHLYYLKFQNYAYLKDFDKLNEIVKFVLSTKEISNYKLQYELWKIREAYISLLIESEVITIQKYNSEEKRFRLAKFMNNVPLFSKEKRGMNVSIIVIQLLFFIIRNQYNDVIDRMDALRQYSFRYLRKDSTFRSNCFIKMLLKIPDADFHPVRTQLYTKELLKKLNSHKLDYEMLTNEIEVIPFHFLWEIIIDVLETNR
jgi:hypothetical protein